MTRSFRTPGWTRYDIGACYRTKVGSNGLVLRFGEFGENLRETSAGLLDKFPGPTATPSPASK